MVDGIRRVPGTERVVTAIGVVAAVATAALLVAPESVRQPVLVGLVGLVTLAPLFGRALQRRWDPFEPVVIICVAGFVLFFLRPVWMWLHGEWVLGSYDARSGLAGAATIALAGFASLIAGYRLDVGRRLARRIPPVPDSWDPSRVVLACFAILMVSALLFGMFIVQGGGGFSTVKTYFTGRDNALATSLVGSPTGERASAYLYLAPYMTLPVTLMLMEVWRRQRKPIFAALGLIVFGLVLLMTVPRGDRTYLLALILPLVVLWYLRRNRRPRALSIIAAVVLSIILANALLQFRDVADRDESLVTTISRGVTHPLESVNEFMLGPDISMVSILAAEYEAIPENLEYKPAQTMTAMIARPVPGTLWQGKPEDPQAYVYASLFPTNAAAIKAGFTPSMFGSFFADSGFVGTVIYSFLCGLGFRSLFDYWRYNQQNRSVAIFYAASLPLLIILMRANPAAALALGLILVAPIAIACWWGARTAMTRPAAPRTQLHAEATARLS